MNTNKFKSLLATVALVILSTGTNSVIASDFSKTSFRDSKWEVSLETKYNDSTKINFDGGAKADINKEWAWGFGIGYNFTNQWALSFDTSWSSVGYSGTRVLDNNNTETVSGSLSTSSFNFTSIYHFSNKRFTPFVGASIGWVFIDTNIADGPPESVCWWDPWWGYICSGYQSTKTSTDFSYGLSVGARFEVKRDLFLRASIGRSWIDFSNVSSAGEFDFARFDIGIMF